MFCPTFKESEYSGNRCSYHREPIWTVPYLASLHISTLSLRRQLIILLLDHFQGKKKKRRDTTQLWQSFNLQEFK